MSRRRWEWRGDVREAWSEANAREPEQWVCAGERVECRFIARRKDEGGSLRNMRRSGEQYRTVQ
jgi:hypothetical protein